MYNVERFLREAIESILAQTFRDFEFIIFDDGSTDNSVAIAESYNDPRIRLFRSPHVGRAAALNKAIDYSTTELLAFMDADDISVKTRFEEQIKFLSENPSIGVVSSWAERIDENGIRLKVIMPPEHHKEIEYQMTRLGAIIFPGSMVRKIILKETDNFDESVLAAIDYEFMLRLLAKTCFYNIQYVLVKYRKNTGSITALNDIALKKNTLTFAIQYLNTVLKSSSSRDDRSEITRRIGIAEYYHGSMNVARKYLFKALLMGDITVNNIRYLLPTFLGSKIFSMYRRQLRKKY